MTDEKQNEVSESKEIPHEINSISDLSKILQTLGEPKEGHTRFFRGHGDESWKLLPSIYRETYLIENEDKIIRDALTYCPDDFLPSDTLFEKLVKLQHYGYSTRLLDLTANALVALYFAAWNKQHHNKNGELIILDIPDEQIKYGDSDTVAILSALALQNNRFNLIEFINRDNTIHRYNFSLEKSLESKQFYEILPSLKIDNEEIEILKEYFDNIPEEEFINSFNLFFNSQPEIIRLLHTIQTDKSSFRPAIDARDLQQTLCVRAKLNNARISRQQGCFLLFGISGAKSPPAAIPNKWQRLASNRQKILVKAENKSAIMEELQSFGISKRTLFPELEAQAKEIMDYYKGQK